MAVLPKMASDKNRACVGGASTRPHTHYASGFFCPCPLFLNGNTPRHLQGKRRIPYIVFRHVGGRAKPHISANAYTDFFYMKKSWNS